MNMTPHDDICRIYAELEKRFQHIGIAIQQNSIPHYDFQDSYVLDSRDTPRIGEAEEAFYNWNCAIITAFRGSDEYSPEDNFKRNIQRNEHLKIDMKALGLKFRPVDGCYKEAGWSSPSVEVCFFVTNTDDTGAKVFEYEEKEDFFIKLYKLAEKYEQDSFLFTFPGINRVAFLVATNDGGRAEFRSDHKFAGPLFTHVQALNAWTDCKDGRISFRLKGMIKEGGLGSKKLKIGEGDIFDIDEYGADGIGIIRGKDQMDLKEACRSFNYKDHLVERYFSKQSLTEDDIKSKVRETLNELKKRGCKKIGFHCSAPLNCNYIAGAKVVVQTVQEWAAKYSKKIDWIVLVDIYGDYNKVK